MNGWMDAGEKVRQVHNNVALTLALGPVGCCYLFANYLSSQLIESVTHSHIHTPAIAW